MCYSGFLYIIQNFQDFQLTLHQFYFCEIFPTRMSSASSVGRIMTIPVTRNIFNLHYDTTNKCQGVNLSVN